MTRDGMHAVPRNREHENLPRGPLEILVVDLARDLHGREKPEERWIDLGAGLIENFCCRVVEERGLSWKIIRRAIQAQTRSGRPARTGHSDSGFEKTIGDDGLQHLVRRRGQGFPPGTLCGMSVHPNSALTAAAPCPDCQQIAVAENIE